MSKDYTQDQLDAAENLIKMLESYPSEKRKIIVIAANAFIEGMSIKNNLLGTNDSESLISYKGENLNRFRTERNAKCSKTN